MRFRFVDLSRFGSLTLHVLSLSSSLLLYTTYYVLLLGWSCWSWWSFIWKCLFVLLSLPIHDTCSFSSSLLSLSLSLRHRQLDSCNASGEGVIACIRTQCMITASFVPLQIPPRSIDSTPSLDGSTPAAPHCSSLPLAHHLPTLLALVSGRHRQRIDSDLAPLPLEARSHSLNRS